MNLDDALAVIAERMPNHIERYRWLCSDENPDEWQRERYREQVIAMASNEPATGAFSVSVRAVQYPGLAEQVGSALGAVGRALGAGLVGLEVIRSGDEIAKCLAICQACEYFVAGDGRCSICGCVAAWKARLATEHCPLSSPRW